MVREDGMNWKELLCEERIREYSSKKTSSDLRTEFEKDYHRIIGSASFRRLQDKTQVFPLDKNDFIRTRLTHSLEVSSFAKSLGMNVGQKIIEQNLDPTFTAKEAEDICAILQCAGLIHDIGNPPFGHFGESAIEDWCRENLKRLEYNGKKITDVLTKQQLQDFYNFEGNTQALRVVTKLHFLVDEHGMNLTKALLSTIIKYPVSSLDTDKHSGDIRTKKMGFFYADKETFDSIQKSCNTNGKRHPLTFLLEAADDIAYKTADIEDGLKKGCYTYEQLLSELKNEEEYAKSDSKYRAMVDMLESRYEKAISKGYEQPDVYAVQNWSIYVQGQSIYAVSDNFIKNYDMIMSGEYKYDIFEGTDVNRLLDKLGEIAYQYIFTSKPIYKLEIAADTIFKFLLDKFMNAVINFDTKNEQSTVNKKIVSLISEDYKRIYYAYSEGKDDAQKLYLRLMLVTDYICGMTDSFAKDLYQELTGTI